MRIIDGATWLKKSDYQARRDHHASNIETALVYARDALNTAWKYHRRKDCLSVAVQALEGALRNVVEEDEEVNDQ